MSNSMEQQSAGPARGGYLTTMSDSLSPESFGGYSEIEPPDLPEPLRCGPSARGGYDDAPGAMSGGVPLGALGALGAAGGQNLPATKGAGGGLPAPMGAGGPPAPQQHGLLQQAGSLNRRAIISSLFFKSKVNAVDLQFMTETDAALHRRGNPRAYVLSGGVLLFFAIFLIWAYIAQLDEVTRGTGQVISATPIQEIQYLEGGVLETMLVREGDDVERGQILARISNERATSDLQRNLEQQAVLRATIARLRAELDGQEPQFPEDLAKSHADVVAGQTALYQNHIDQRSSEMRALESQLDQREREVEEAKSRQKTLAASLAISIESRDRIKPLVDRKVYSPIDFLRIEQEVERLRGDLDTAVLTVSRSESAVNEARERITGRQREWVSTIQDEYNQKNAALTEVTALINQGVDTVSRKEVRSPVNGKVKRILINTIGGTVPSGATIMEILPVDDQLLIEAKISPNDRAFLRTSDNPAEKQPAIVKITAYDFSVFGGLEATLEYISEDTIEDKRGEVYFEVRLLTKSNAIDYRGQKLPIMPGMTAQVDILTGKKSVLSYLMKPLIKAQQNALRER
ncbi:MAG: HlyD family type I secretion periplasmic adaptor subunit [Deltaproteobacteria bacterium]|jgi:adhesin transport system membrane fusion protein|nr:HlyD family type I secretion periplasmic adaptor subunit [Deltaproteobacteria bacterium]